MNRMNYKGYEAEVNVSVEDRLIVGKVINSYDLILFQGRSFDELEEDFHRAVEEHLDMVQRGLATAVAKN